MAEKPTKKPEEDAEPPAQAPAAPKTSPFQRFITVKWLLIVVGLSLALHGAAFAYLRLQQRAESPASPEVALGAFHFEADRAEGGRIAQADFSLHIALLEPSDTAARWRLTAHKRHVQQAIEELLRKAHGGDFDDPGVHDLKRQLLEQINQALGTRTISEVIVTDLKLQRIEESKPAVSRTVHSLPWEEASAGSSGDERPSSAAKSTGLARTEKQ